MRSAQAQTPVTLPQPLVADGEDILQRISGDDHSTAQRAHRGNHVGAKGLP
jgi:hypothetical protein